MKVDVKLDWTVGTLVDLKHKQILRVNHEYQRGLRWTTVQKCMFIDSILRGYSIPAFYFHRHMVSAGSIENTFYDVVDGQQRIDAIYSYSEGAFPLLDPSKEAGSRFPLFVKDHKCPWADKRFGELTGELREQLTSHRVVVYEMATSNDNAIRDLFIRLQGGTPLSPQDKRDSWPGNFTEFVLQVGGKQEVAKWPGEPLFNDIARGNPSRRRQLAAQMFMLFVSIRNDQKMCDIKSENIDAFYHAHVGFDKTSDEAQRFIRVCKKMHDAFADKPKIPGHYLIHVALLVDSLLEHYVPGWETRLAQCLNDFEVRRKAAADATKKGIDTEYGRYYSEYGQWTQTRSDDAHTIRRRHAFFSEQLLGILGAKKRDTKRQFGAFERQVVFFRDMELCQWCRMGGNEHRVTWAECEIHHVVPYSDGGDTEIRNGALVHRDCHPKKEEDVQTFKIWWQKHQ